MVAGGGVESVAVTKRSQPHRGVVALLTAALTATLATGCVPPRGPWSWLTAPGAAEADCAQLRAAAAPATPRRTFALAWCLEGAGERQAAIAAFADAAATLDRAADRATALHNLGTLLALSHRDADALDAFRAALRLGDRASTRLNHDLVAGRQGGLPPPPPATSARDEARIFAAARALERPRPSTTRDQRMPERDW